MTATMKGRFSNWKERLRKKEKLVTT